MQVGELGLQLEQALLDVAERIADGRQLASGRLLLVAAPEIAHDGEPAECFGDEAHDYLRGRLPEGTPVRLQAGVEDTDGFGRPLRYAFLGDELLNETIVREGYAERYRDSPDTTYRAQIIAAEQDARANNRGLWSACR